MCEWINVCSPNIRILHIVEIAIKMTFQLLVQFARLTFFSPIFKNQHLLSRSPYSKISGWRSHIARMSALKGHSIFIGETNSRSSDCK
jgi:hypothetical protein